MKKKKKKNRNVNTLTIAAETGYNQVIQRGEKIKPSVHAKFAFTSVNCKGVIKEKKKKKEIVFQSLIRQRL